MGAALNHHKSYNSLNSFNGVYRGIVWVSIIGVLKGDVRSLDHSSETLRILEPWYRDQDIRVCVPGFGGCGFRMRFEGSRFVV